MVDDCSTDGTAMAVETIQDSRIRLIRQPTNGGAAAARNTGGEAAAGDLIAFQDSDDVSLFDRLEQQLALLSSLPEDYVGVYSAAIVSSMPRVEGTRIAKLWVLPPLEQSKLVGDLFEATVRGNFINLPTMLVRRQALITAGPFDERLRNNEDWDLTLRLTKIGPFGFTALPLYVINYVPPSFGGGHISNSDKYSSQSFVRIFGKLRRLGFSGTEVAEHYTSAGRFLASVYSINAPLRDR